MWPLILALGPILLALLSSLIGKRGVVVAAASLSTGCVLWPFTGIWAIVNCIIYRQNRIALTLSLFTLIGAACAFGFEIWRIKRELDNLF